MNDAPRNSEATQIQRSRAVFSSEYFELIRTAVGRYLQDVKNPTETVKYSNLYHRLGRITR
jgi:hypothetical protein